MKPLAIYRYEVAPLGGVEMPAGAQILSAGPQMRPDGTWAVCVWAVVDPDADLELRHVVAVATGTRTESGVLPGTFVGTVQVPAGGGPVGSVPFNVWHVFDGGGHGHDAGTGGAVALSNDAEVVRAALMRRNPASPSGEWAAHDLGRELDPQARAPTGLFDTGPDTAPRELYVLRAHVALRELGMERSGRYVGGTDRYLYSLQGLLSDDTTGPIR